MRWSSTKLWTDEGEIGRRLVDSYNVAEHHNLSLTANLIKAINKRYIGWPGHVERKEILNVRARFLLKKIPETDITQCPSNTLQTSEEQTLNSPSAAHISLLCTVGSWVMRRSARQWVRNMSRFSLPVPQPPEPQQRSICNSTFNKQPVSHMKTVAWPLSTQANFLTATAGGLAIRTPTREVATQQN